MDGRPAGEASLQDPETEERSLLLDLDRTEGIWCPCRKPTVQNCSGLWNCSGGAGLTADNATPCQKGNCVEDIACSWNWKVTIDWSACNPIIQEVWFASCTGDPPTGVKRPGNGVPTEVTGTCHSECETTARPLIVFKDQFGIEVGRCELHMPCESCD